MLSLDEGPFLACLLALKTWYPRKKRKKEEWTERAKAHSTTVQLDSFSLFSSPSCCTGVIILLDLLKNRIQTYRANCDFSLMLDLVYLPVYFVDLRCGMSGRKCS